jgi:hypothetical protein
MTERKFRHEYKYFISYSDYLALKSRLDVVAQRDPHAGPEGKYFIRSLYFDNVYDKALREKVDGINNREKFRIRCYNGDDSFVRLEKKSKIDGLCNKISAPVTRDEVMKIIDRDIEWMKDSKHGLIVELYSKMRAGLLKPRVLVDYTREPYIYKPGNVRITFDYDIKTGLYNKEIFDFKAPTIPTNAESILLEVKFDEFLPGIIQDILQVNNRQSQAFSKYGACRMYG